jgi:hypothetical protein
VDFGTVDDGRVKRTQLVDFTATLARLLTRRGSRVGAMLFASKLDRTIPAAGEHAQCWLVRDLQAEPPRAGAGDWTSAALFEAAHRQIRRRSMVVIVSDFISAPGWRSRCTCSTGGTRCWRSSSRIRASELPDVGPIVVQDSRPASSSWSTPTTAAGPVRRGRRRAPRELERLREPASAP